MVTFLKTYSVSDGVTASEATPGNESLYLSPDDALAIFGCAITAEQSRYIQSVIDSHCNRTSLWPTEWETGSINVPPDRQEIRVPVLPVIRILEAAGRYGMGRRDRHGYNSLVYGLAPMLALNSGRPQWQPMNVDTLELSPQDGTIWLPWSNMLMPFSFVRLRLISGFVDIPHRVKAAVVEIANVMGAMGVSSRTRYNVGRVSRTFATASFISPLAAQMLAPFVVTSLA